MYFREIREMFIREKYQDKKYFKWSEMFGQEGELGMVSYGPFVSPDFCMCFSPNVFLFVSGIPTINYCQLISILLA